MQTDSLATLLLIEYFDQGQDIAVYCVMYTVVILKNMLTS